MTALPLNLRPRVARLLPLLGSPVDGEAVAAARAIDRVLGSAGLDLHDLAAAVGHNAAAASPLPQHADLSQMLDDCIAAEARLFDKELHFVESLAEQVLRGYRPSDRQMSWLFDIHDRVRSGT